MLRQWTTLPFSARGAGGRRRRWGMRGLTSLQLFQLQLQLLDLASDFFALGTEHHAPKLGNDQLQMFDLTVASKQFLLLRHHKGFERLSIQSAQINNTGMRISHGTEYAIVMSQL